MDKTVHFFFVILLLLGFVGPADALDVIYPEDGTYFTGSSFLIVKCGDNPVVEGVTVEINGLKSGLLDISSPEYKAAFADFLILEAGFSVGENNIKVESFVNGKQVAKASANVFYLDDPYAIPPNEYRPYIMHTPPKESLCSPCHNMQPSSSQITATSADKNPCGECHSRMLNKKYVHGPAGVFKCIECHDPVSKPSKYKVVAQGADVCNGCHVGKVKEFQNNKFVHGPVAVGMCEVCHDSHASDYRGQLHGEVNAVCLNCHEGLNVNMHFTTGVGKGHPVAGYPDPSQSGRQLSCVSCHNPHGGASRVFFDKTVTSAMMICQRCHKK